LDWKNLYSLSKYAFAKKRDILRQGVAQAELTNND
tara:strand:+ start:2200 stop:2304 length:105 start_codon:yes stop_codon:yes gene_type:complete